MLAEELRSNSKRVSLLAYGRRRRLSHTDGLQGIALCHHHIICSQTRDEALPRMRILLKHTEHYEHISFIVRRVDSRLQSLFLFGCLFFFVFFYRPIVVYICRCVFLSRILFRTRIAFIFIPSSYSIHNNI